MATSSAPTDTGGFPAFHPDDDEEALARGYTVMRKALEAADLTEPGERD